MHPLWISLIIEEEGGLELRVDWLIASALKKLTTTKEETILRSKAESGASPWFSLITMMRTGLGKVILECRNEGKGKHYEKFFIWKLWLTYIVNCDKGACGSSLAAFKDLFQVIWTFHQIERKPRELFELFKSRQFSGTPAKSKLHQSKRNWSFLVL